MQIEEARANLNGVTSIVEYLVTQGLVSADDISRSLAAQAQMQWVDLADTVVPQDVIDEIKPRGAPLQDDPDRAQRTRPRRRDRRSARLRQHRQPQLLAETRDRAGLHHGKKIQQALVKYYGNAEEAVDILREKIGDTAIQELDIVEGAELQEVDGGDAPIIRMVSMLLLEAHKLGASDIHLEPLEKTSASDFGLTGSSRKCNRLLRNCNRPLLAGSRS